MPELVVAAKALTTGTLFSLAVLWFPYQKAPNLNGQKIPLQGLYLGIAYLAFFAKQDLLLALIAFGICLAGWLDDKWASREKGFRGHFGALSKGRVTSGFFKAIAILCLSLLFALEKPLPYAPFAALFLALFCNFFNQLDCFPGRAGKAFLLLSFAAGSPFFVPLLYLPFFFADLRKKAMLGDAGANLLGFIAGIQILRSSKVVWLSGLLLLILVEIYTEKNSLSDLIRRNRVLSFLDRALVKKS